MTAETFATDVATRRQIFIQRFAGGEAVKAQRVLNRMRAAILERLARDPTDFQANRLTQLLNEINGITRGFMQELGVQTLEMVESFAVAEAEFSVGLLQQAATPVAATPAPGVVQQAVLASGMAAPVGPSALTIQEALDQFGKAKALEIQRAIQDAVLLGDTLQQTTRAVGAIQPASVPAKASQEVADLIRTRHARQVETLTRTIINHTANEASRAVMRENAALLEGEKWVATLDSRTTLICFEGSTPVVPLGRLEAIFRRKYRGEMITITTAAGHKIKGTPNHPILTDRGWLPLNEIKPNEHIVYAESGYVGSVLGDENIDMPSQIAELFDAARELSGFDVERVRPTADDFHGDGQVEQGHISVVTVDSFLRRRLVARFGQRVKDDSLSLVELPARLDTVSLGDELVGGGLPVSEAAQLDLRGVQGGVHERLGPTEPAAYIGGADAVSEQPDDLRAVIHDPVVADPARSVWHDANILKSVRHCGGGDSVALSDAAGGFSGTVTGDQVVDVCVEFSSCHVYNLQTSLNLYSAGGIIVHNCGGRDGRMYPVGEGPYPPAHWNCRSRRVPIVRDEFAVKGVTGQRGFVGADGRGQVKATTDYQQFLARQPADFQDEVLGPARGQLFREGGLTVDKFRDETGRTYSLERLRELEPMAFQRAGLE